MFHYIPIFLCLLWAGNATAQGFQVGDAVSFPDNRWIWRISILRPDVGGSQIVASGIQTGQRRLYKPIDQLFHIVDEADGFEAGHCYKIPGNRLLWKILGLTPEIPGLTAAKAFLYNPDVTPSHQRKAVLIKDLLERFECTF